MKQWKICLAMHFILILMPLALLGQEDKSQELVTLLNSGDFFKSRELHQQIYDTISPEIDLYYKFRMAQFVNKKDSTILYLEKIFSEYPDLFGDDIINVYGILFDTYINLRNNEGGLCTYKRMSQHLKENPYNINEDELVQWEKDTEYRLFQLKYAVKQPCIRIRRKEANDFVRILGVKHLLVAAYFNNLPQKVLLDTGAQSYCFMSKSKAELLEIKCDTSEIATGIINEYLPANKAIIDSIEIGNITLYNIPVDVYQDDVQPVSSDSTCIFPVTPIILGLPLMKLIGKLLIDNENKRITFPIYDDDIDCFKEPNMFVYNDNLYTRLTINEKDFTSFLDTGADEFIGIDTTFYKKYKNEITLDTITAIKPFSYVTLGQVFNHTTYLIPHSPIIKFENRVLPILRKRSVKIYPVLSTSSTKYFDGMIGYHCFRRLGKKVLLDLDNMRLEVEKPAN